MAEDLDLLGDPIPANWLKRGRPPHMATEGNRNKVMLLLALGWEEAKVAAALAITLPTLRKHYFRELKVRVEARARLEASMMMGLAAKALSGDVPATREIRRVFEKLDLAETDQSFRGTAAGARRGEAKAPKLGLKEQRQQAAEQIGGKFAPGAPPSKYHTN